MVRMAIRLQFACEIAVDSGIDELCLSVRQVVIAAGGIAGRQDPQARLMSNRAAKLGLHCVPDGR